MADDSMDWKQLLCLQYPHTDPYMDFFGNETKKA